ncbi:uncharacterized protein LOC108658155, partial [Drosophila navojoa]
EQHSIAHQNQNQNQHQQIYTSAQLADKSKVQEYDEYSNGLVRGLSTTAAVQESGSSFLPHSQGNVEWISAMNDAQNNA